MPFDPGDLTELAELLAPMATTAELGRLLGAMQQSGLPVDGIHGDIDKTEKWLQSLDDATLRTVLGNLVQVPVVVAALSKLAPAASASTPQGGPRPHGPWRFALGLYPTVNRDPFWTNLQAMLDTPKRILVVRGDPGVGKTFTGEIMLKELPRQNKAVPIQVVYLRVNGANSIENIVNGILQRLKLPVADLPTLDAHRSTDVGAKKEWWIREMVDQLLIRIHDDVTRQVWLALDGHAKDGAHAELTMFFTELVNQAAQWATEPNGFRLILIDHPDVVAQGPTRFLVLREEVRVATEADVVLFLDDVFGKKPEHVDRAASIWAKVQQHPIQDRMHALAHELSGLNPKVGAGP